MSPRNIHSCIMCKRIIENHKMEDSKSLFEFFINYFNKKNTKMIMYFCIWCKTVLKRAKYLLECILLENPDDKTKKVYNLSCSKTILFNIPMTEHLDDTCPIIPKENEKSLKEEDIIQHNDILVKYLPEEDFISTDNGLKDVNEDYKYSQEIFYSDDDGRIENFEEIKVSKEKKSFSKSKRKNYKKAKNSKQEILNKECNFEMTYLSLSEQDSEIREKIQSKKYKFHCELCGSGFLTEDDFEEHKIRHTESSGPHECVICQLRFKSQDILSHHLLAHRRRFRCKLCDATFKRWTRCVEHRFKCGSSLEHVKCEECSKIFSNHHSLNIHIRSIHNIQKKYVCETCNTKFGTKQKLTVHSRTHTGIRPYACDTCEKLFTTSSNLKAHKSVHDTSKTHYCVECNVHYKTMKSLKRHLAKSSRHVLTTEFLRN